MIELFDGKVKLSKAQIESILSGGYPDIPFLNNTQGLKQQLKILERNIKSCSISHVSTALSFIRKYINCSLVDITADRREGVIIETIKVELIDGTRIIFYLSGSRLTMKFPNFKPEIKLEPHQDLVYDKVKMTWIIVDKLLK